MRLSQRVQSLTASPIRKLVPYSDAAKAAGKKVYHLNIGQPDIETPPQFMDSVRAFEQKVIAYGNSKGEPVLLQAIQKYYAKWDMEYSLDDIFITNGGSEALQFAIMALCDPGDELLVFEPYYANYTTFATEYGANIVAVPTNVENGYHLPSQSEIESRITSSTKGILLPNPGNPTGVVYSTEEMNLLADIARKYDLAIISDEVYREFVYDGEYTSFGKLAGLDDNLIIIDSVSKRFSACGARIGCIISKNKTLGKEIMKCCQARLCCPTLEQVAAAALYNTPEEYLQNVNKEYKKRRDTIVAELKKIPGVQASDPKGAFYVMAALPVDDAEKFAIWLLEHFDIDGETVMFAPGNGFYKTPGRGVNECRMAYVINSEALAKAIYILGEALKVYPGRTI